MDETRPTLSLSFSCFGWKRLHCVQQRVKPPSVRPIAFAQRFYRLILFLRVLRVNFFFCNCWPRQLEHFPGWASTGLSPLHRVPFPLLARGQHHVVFIWMKMSAILQRLPQVVEVMLSRFEATSMSMHEASAREVWISWRSLAHVFKVEDFWNLQLKGTWAIS